jgi:urease accessory protein UreE
VLARLAGFLAGQVALNEDPMRKVMEALMHGYGEAESPPERDHHGHGHEHHHDHDDGHDDGHAHEH